MPKVLTDSRDWWKIQVHVSQLFMLPQLLLFLMRWDEGLFESHLASLLTVTECFSRGEWSGWLIAQSGHCSLLSHGRCGEPMCIVSPEGATLNQVLAMYMTPYSPWHPYDRKLTGGSATRNSSLQCDRNDKLLSWTYCINLFHPYDNRYEVGWETKPRFCMDKHVIQRFYTIPTTLSATAPQLCHLPSSIFQLGLSEFIREAPPLILQCLNSISFC